MLLNQTAIYALRAMAVMAGIGADSSLTVDELSDRTGVPKHYLSKVMRRLVQAGLVRGQRGHGGGFGLLRPAHTIRLGAILAAADCDVDAGRCAFGFAACDPKNPCALHPVWSRFQDGVREFTERTTLADCGPQLRRRPRK
jgi:Rrf2 family iron-sulfur cluster assembly transcriptional regulator